MFYKRIYFKTHLYILGIVLLSVVGVLSIVSGKAIILGSALLVVSIFFIGKLTKMLNNYNYRIQHFLNAMIDNESKLHFPENKVDPELRNLYSTLNKINKLIYSIKEESKKNEYFYKELIHQIPCGLISWDKKGYIKLINDEALRLLRASHIKYLHQVEQIIPNLQCLIKESIENGNSIFKIEQEESIQQLSLSVSQIIIDNDELTILSIKNIQRELGQKEFESWDKLTHVLTHEIMNSIAPIVSLSDTLLSYFQTGDNIQNEITALTVSKTIRGLDTIRNQGKGLIRLTNSYRRLSYIRQPVCSPFSLFSHLEKIKLLFNTELSRLKIQLNILKPNIDIIIIADKELISQVIINLIKNAIESLTEQDNGLIEITMIQNDMTVIEIKDNGPGISQDILNDIFVPFFTTKATGSGVGLSVSRQIIRMHNGELTVSSVPYTQTVFKIAIPH